MEPTNVHAFALSGQANWDILLGGVFVVIFAGVALYARAVPQGDRRWWILGALLGGLVIIGQVAGPGIARVLLLDAAAFVAVAMVWTRGTPQAAHAARIYLELLVLAVVCLGAGLMLGGEGTTPPPHPLDKVAVGLLLVGLGLKLALVPFYFWLPGIAEYASPMTSALIISVVDIAAFSEMAHLRLVSPWVFTQHETLWLVIALLSMFGGAVLALAQRNLKRLLAFSTVDDMGYLLLGTVLGPTMGLEGAQLAALSHALFKVLLFGAVGLAESQMGKDISLDDRGLASRYPISGAAFIVGALGMIGIPPLFGFIGRWRLYLAGAEYGGVGLVLAMALATGLSLLYYVRAIHRVWLGQSPDEGFQAGEPKLAATVLAVLMTLTVVLGLLPGLITGFI